jgi:hypothetical protein
LGVSLAVSIEALLQFTDPNDGRIRPAVGVR